MATDNTRRRRIQPFLEHWIEALRLGDWDFSWKLAGESDLDRHIGGGRPSAQTSFNAPYNKVFIRFDREVVDACDDGEMERCVMHELLHAKLWPYRAATLDYSDAPIGRAILQADEAVIDALTVTLYHMRHPKSLNAPYDTFNLEGA